MGRLISEKFKEWEKECRDRFDKLKANEEELNRIFIELYGLQGELDPKEEPSDVTVKIADEVREIKSLISYAVGCIMGRYSLDEDGLVFAGGSFDMNRYKTFKPDDDGIIPILEDDILGKEDIISKFVSFIETVYGKDTLEENLNYIASVLKSGNVIDAKQTIREYFVKDFYKNHCKQYFCKPIYWMFDSGKKNACKFLVYLHRYNKDTVATIKTQYMPKIQTAYERTLSDIEYKLKNNEDLSKKESSDLKKEETSILEKIEECKVYYNAISHIADKRIDLNLDDGVDVNYIKFDYEDKKKVYSVLAKRK